MSELAQAQLPELALATAFERDMLNARIFFIYHVTIQKPGALASEGSESATPKRSCRN